MENSGRAKVYEFNYVVRGHDAIVELQIAVGQTNLVQVLNTVADLPKHAINFGTGHLARHDDAEKIVRCIFHDLKERKLR